MILYINACVREESRTDRLAREVLKKLALLSGDEIREERLEDLNLQPLNRERLDKRNALVFGGDFDNPMFALAREFKEAEAIVISSPFWDLSFPSLLKLYIENIYIVGLVTRFSPEGVPEGLCKAKKLYYVSTAGGDFAAEYGYNYIKDVVTRYFGVKETALISAERLDIVGYDAQEIMRETIDNLQV